MRDELKVFEMMSIITPSDCSRVGCALHVVWQRTEVGFLHLCVDYKFHLNTHINRHYLLLYFSWEFFSTQDLNFAHWQIFLERNEGSFALLIQLIIFSWLRETDSFWFHGWYYHSTKHVPGKCFLFVDFPSLLRYIEIN